MFKVNNRNTEIRCEICSRIPIKTPERCQWRCSSVFIINFEHSVFPCPCSSVVNFEPVNGSRVSHTNFHLNSRLVISSEEIVGRCLAKNCVENSLKHVTLLTRRLCHTCHMFPVHVANIFRAALSHNNSRRLILKIHFISLNFLCFFFVAPTGEYLSGLQFVRNFENCFNYFTIFKNFIEIGTRYNLYI